MKMNEYEKAYVIGYIEGIAFASCALLFVGLVVPKIKKKFASKN